jgi:hypothetical protein
MRRAWKGISPFDFEEVPLNEGRTHPKRVACRRTRRRTHVKPGGGDGISGRFRGPAGACNGALRATGLGKRVVKWLDAPHLPHGWETGYLMDLGIGTMLRGNDVIRFTSLMLTLVRLKNRGRNYGVMT